MHLSSLESLAAPGEWKISPPALAVHFSQHLIYLKIIIQVQRVAIPWKPEAHPQRPVRAQAWTWRNAPPRALKVASIFKVRWRTLSITCRLSGEAADAWANQGQPWLGLSKGDYVPGGGRVCPLQAVHLLWWWSAPVGGLPLPSLLNMGYMNGSCTFLEGAAMYLTVLGISATTAALERTWKCIRCPRSVPATT